MAIRDGLPSVKRKPPTMETNQQPQPQLPKQPQHQQALRPYTSKYRLQGRLPDGANFNVRYNAQTMTWAGTLVVNGKTYTGSASGVFKLLERLDRCYRQDCPG